MITNKLELYKQLKKRLYSSPDKTTLIVLTSNSYTYHVTLHASYDLTVDSLYNLTVYSNFYLLEPNEPIFLKDYRTLLSLINDILIDDNKDTITIQ